MKINQRALDLAMARFAYERAVGNRTYHWMRSDGDKARHKHTFVKILRDICAQIVITGKQLTKKQRAFVEKQCRFWPEAVAKMRAECTEDDTPAVLRELPKKPPGRAA